MLCVMSLLRNTSVPGFIVLLAAAPSCATTGARGPAETPEERCSRMAAMPHVQVPPVKIAGDPAAYLTPDGIEAGVPSAVAMRCRVTRKGHLGCELPKGIPPSQGASIETTLRGWRFRPATFDGVPIAHSLDVSIPLVTPPPDWKPPQLPPKGDTRELGEDLTPPSLLSGPAHPMYTREALESCTEGRVIARCTITTEGRLVDCDIIQSVPHLDDIVLDTLSRQRYSPVMFQGHPQSVYYTLPFTFRLP